jgi:hypothetical protein
MDETAAGSMIAPGLLAEEARKARRLFRQALVVRGVLLGLVVGVLGLVSFALMPFGIFTVSSVEAMVLLIALAVCSLAAALAAIIFVPVVIPLEPNAHDVNAGHDALPKVRHVGDRLHARAVHSGSWSSVPALLGFVLVIAGGDATAYAAFLGITIVSSLVSFPRWSAWERAYVENVGIELPRQ